MRLINADALIKDLEHDVELDARALDDADLLLGRNRELVQFDKDCKENAIYLLKDATTVDAVPVSLIQSEIDFLTLAAEGEMEVTGQHGEVYAELAELKKLMSLWENEREKHD